jgi:hypothetical protein
MKTTRLLWNTSVLATLILLSSCGGSGGNSSTTVVDRASVRSGSDPVVVTLGAAKKARTEFELPALATRSSVDLVLEETASTTGDVSPANGLVLNVATPGLSFTPPAIMRQALAQAPSGQEYVAVSISPSASSWTVGAAARQSSFRDGEHPEPLPSGTGVWEMDVSGSGRWAFALVARSRPDGGALGGVDSGAGREAGLLIVDGGGFGDLLDGALVRWDVGARVDVTSLDTPVDRAIDLGVPEAPAIDRDAQAPIDEASASNADPDAALDIGGRHDGASIGDAPASNALLASPAAGSFGNVVVGSQSAAITVTVSNPGSTAASVSATVTGPGFLIAASTCTDVLASRGSCQISLKLAPTQLGPLVGSLVVGTDLAIPLSGTGVDVALTLTAPSVPATEVGSTAVVAVPLAFNGPVNDLACTASNASFTIQMGTCSKSYGAAGDCALQLTFAPTSAGTASGLLTCSATGAGNATVSLTGTAVVSHFTVPVTSLSFGEVATGSTSAATSISIHNDGTVATGALALTLSGTSAPSFSFTTT